MVRNSFEDGDANSESDDQSLVMLLMNETFKQVLVALSFNAVPSAPKMGTFYELVLGNYDFML